MNKTSLASNSILFRTVFLFIVCALIILTSVKSAKADGAPPPEPDMGGVAPYQPIETNVQMMSETVLIDVLPHPTRWTTSEFNWNSNQVKVRASFTLRNQGATEEKMQVIFPLSRLDYPWLTSSYNIIGSSFVAIVDGKPVPITQIATPPELQATPEGLDTPLPDGLFLPDVGWAGFDVTFPVQKDVIVQVEYDMRADIMTGLHHVDYILETGAGWYGNILSADIIVHLPYPATPESVPQAAAGCAFSGNEVQCKIENFEPQRKDNLSFGFIDTNDWSPALELRSRVEQYPDDADAWFKLGEKYYRLGLWWEDVLINQHMVDLSIEAFEKSIALRPDWGDAHLQLARVLWYNNPKYIRGFGGGARQMNLKWEDPLIQRTIQELKLAASYGITEDNYSYDNLANQIHGAFPDLEPSQLPAHIKLTSTPTNPTVTPASTSSTIQEVKTIALGNYHTCVLTTGREVKCQGLNVKTQVVGDFKAVVAGDFYTCLLTTSGGVKCMGKNNFGQLGDGTTIDREILVDVVGLTGGVSALVAGDNHTCALMTGGGVKCWGRNYFGQLGGGTTAYSLVPVNVDGLTDGVSALVAGSDHTCAFMLAGGIKCWGANEAGQLGDGSLLNRLKPVDIVGLSDDVTALAAGFAHTCTLDSQGQVMCWGDNSHEQLGDGNPVVHIAPAIVQGLDIGIVKIAAGNGYTCALTSKGVVKCWGRNDFGQIGGFTTEDSSTPIDVIGLPSGVVDVAAGNNHNCTIMQNGRVRCWGMTEYGYSGSETEYGIQADATPTAIPELPTAAPAPLLTATPTETSSPTTDLIWDLTLLIAIGVLVLLLRRSKVGGRR